MGRVEGIQARNGADVAWGGGGGTPIRDPLHTACPSAASPVTLAHLVMPQAIAGATRVSVSSPWTFLCSYFDASAKSGDGVHAAFAALFAAALTHARGSGQATAADVTNNVRLSS